MKTDLATELILHGTAQYPTSYSSAELRTVVTVPGWLLVLAQFQGPLVRQLLAAAQLVWVVKRNEALPMDAFLISLAVMLTGESIKTRTASKPQIEGRPSVRSDWEHRGLSARILVQQAWPH